MAHPGGRPTKYTAELLDKCYDYLENYKSVGDVVPSHIGLAIYIEISSTCLYDWAQEESKKEFSDILGQCMDIQYQGLTNGGLLGELNSNITKLMLGKHGLSEKTDTKYSGAIGVVDLSDKTDDELKDIIKGE